MREIDSLVREYLILHNFKLRRNSWYRQTSDFIQVINLQKSCFANQYYLNMGIDVVLDRVISYKPEYKFPVRCRAEMITQKNELLQSIDFTNDISGFIRQAQLNELLAECIAFLNSIQSWEDFIKVLEDIKHPIHKAAITSSFKQLLNNHWRV